MSMKLTTLVVKLQELDPFEVQKFWDKSYEGACPCFSGKRVVDNRVVNVWGRCWRVSEGVKQDLYVWGTVPALALKMIGNILKQKLDEQEWYNEYRLILHDPEGRKHEHQTIE